MSEETPKKTQSSPPQEKPVEDARSLLPLLRTSPNNPRRMSHVYTATCKGLTIEQLHNGFSISDWGFTYDDLPFQMTTEKIDLHSKNGRTKVKTPLQPFMDAVLPYYKGAHFVHVVTVSAYAQKYNFNAILIEIQSSDVNNAKRFAIYTNYKLLVETMRCSSPDVTPEVFEEEKDVLARHVLAHHFRSDFDTVTEYIKSYLSAPSAPDAPLSRYFNPEKRASAPGTRGWYMSLCERYLAELVGWLLS